MQPPGSASQDRTGQSALGSRHTGLPSYALMWIPLLTGVFFALVMWGLAQVHKGGYLHQLNALHLKYAFELHLILEAPEEFPVGTLRETIQSIARQPDQCLAQVTVLDHAFMRIIGTRHAIDLCQEDLRAAQRALAILDDFEHGALSEREARAALEAAARRFAERSAAFEPLIAKTAFFTARGTFVFLVAGGLTVWFCLGFLTRTIGRAMQDMEATTQALTRSEERTKRMAYMDSVTALANRPRYTQCLQSAIAQAKERGAGLAVMFFDLDGFKIINDDLGHQAGDQVLVRTAERLAARVRGEDTVARFGGDEFAAVLTDLDNMSGIAAVCEDLIRRVAEPIEIDGQQVGVTTSIGVAVYPQHGEDATALMKNADIAMYEAKGAGKNRFRIFDRSLQDHITDRMRTQRDLRRAIEREQLHLHYQPVVRLRGQRVEGAEALLRWQHPERGNIPPDVFIPVAEETGLIAELGEWVLQQATLQCASWRQQSGGKDMRVAVNVSPRQLAVPNFAAVVERTLAISQLPVAAVDLELTETSFMGEHETCIRNLHELAELGVRLLLDDFGTGYSSFSYLHSLPFQVLKIDRSLIRDIEVGGRSFAIVSSILSMSRGLSMSVIAEGVETQKSLDVLRGLGCASAQGYFFQRPVAPEQFDLLAHYKRQDRSGSFGASHDAPAVG